MKNKCGPLSLMVWYGETVQKLWLDSSGKVFVSDGRDGTRKIDNHGNEYPWPDPDLENSSDDDDNDDDDDDGDETDPETKTSDDLEPNEFWIEDGDVVSTTMINDEGGLWIGFHKNDQVIWRGEVDNSQFDPEHDGWHCVVEVMRDGIKETFGLNK